MENNVRVGTKIIVDENVQLNEYQIELLEKHLGIDKENGEQIEFKASFIEVPETGWNVVAQVSYASKIKALMDDIIVISENVPILLANLCYNVGVEEGMGYNPGDVYLMGVTEVVVSEPVDKEQLAGNFYYIEKLTYNRFPR